MFRCCMSVSKVEDPSIPVLTRVSVKNEDPIIDAAKDAVDSLDANVDADAEGDAKTMPEDDVELVDVCRDFITLDAIICTVVVVSFVTFFASLIEHVPKEEECVLEGF